jgi:hypothetical protein
MNLDLPLSQSTSGCEHDHIHRLASIVEVGRHTRRTKIHERRTSRSSRQTETRGSQVRAGEGEEMSRKKSYPWFWRSYLYSPAMVSLNSANGIMSLFSTKLNYRELPGIRYVSEDARNRDRPATHLGDKQIKVSVIRVKMRYSQTFKRSSVFDSGQTRYPNFDWAKKTHLRSPKRRSDRSARNTYERTPGTTSSGSSCTSRGSFSGTGRLAKRSEQFNVSARTCRYSLGERGNWYGCEA